MMLQLCNGMISFFTIFAGFIVVVPLTTADDPCRFEHSKGVIDLSSLAHRDGTPAYPDVIPPSGSSYKYSYNPCQPFTEQPNCIDVAVCQVSVDGKYSFTLGKQESAVWSAGAGLGSSPTVSYLEGQKQVQVALVCGDESTNDFDALGEGPINTYKFKLTHKCACWDGCKGGSETTTKSGGGGGGGGGGGTGGTIFIVVLVVPLVAYFLFFMIFYYIRARREGNTVRIVELIPHRGFWSALPGYAKGGVMFAYQKATNRGGHTYASV